MLLAAFEDYFSLPDLFVPFSAVVILVLAPIVVAISLVASRRGPWPARRLDRFVRLSHWALGLLWALNVFLLIWMFRARSAFL